MKAAQRVGQWQFAPGKALCKGLPRLAPDARISAVKGVTGTLVVAVQGIGTWYSPLA